MRDFRVPLAWTLFGLTSLLAVGQVVILHRAEAPLFSTENLDDGFPLVTVAAVVASAVGALIVSRYPRHRIGWLFLVGQAGTILGLFAQSYAYVAMTESFGPHTVAQWFMWMSLQFGGVFAVTLVSLLLLLAPDGTLLSPRWRWAVAVVMLGIVVHNGAALAIDPTDLTAESTAPGTPSAILILTLVGALLHVVGLVCAAVSLFKRLRGASGVARAQLRWIAAAATSMAVSLSVGVLLSLALDVADWVTVAPLMVAYLALPICTGVAILRWRLYDIDLILNRSVVLALLTGFVALGYVAVVVALAELAHDQAAWPSFAATALVALAFQPARRRTTQLADRVVYGERAAPYEALAAFNEELRRSSALTELLPRTAEAVGTLFGADRVRVWIDVAGHAPAVAEWPTDAAASGAVDEERLAVLDSGDQLGGLALSMPRGRSLRRSDRRLLDDFVAQLGTAFRAVQLESELSARVELLRRHGEELAASQARLRSAQSEEARRFEAAIADQVLPFVRPLPQRLRTLEKRAASGRWPASDVDGVIDDAHRGLEALRTLTRGVFPAQLTRRGLATALATHLDRAGPPHTLDVQQGAHGRFSPEVESAAYFCAVEVVRRCQGAVHLGLRVAGDDLVLTLDGHSSRSLPHETRHLVDRVEALGGTVSLEVQGERTTCTVRIPLASRSQGVQQLEEPVGAEV